MSAQEINFRLEGKALNKRYFDYISWKYVLCILPPICPESNLSNRKSFAKFEILRRSIVVFKWDDF